MPVKVVDRLKDADGGASISATAKFYRYLTISALSYAFQDYQCFLSRRARDASTLLGLKQAKADL